MVHDVEPSRSEPGQSRKNEASDTECYGGAVVGGAVADHQCAGRICGQAVERVLEDAPVGLLYADLERKCPFVDEAVDLESAGVHAQVDVDVADDADPTAAAVEGSKDVPCVRVDRMEARAAEQKAAKPAEKPQDPKAPAPNTPQK